MSFTASPCSGVAVGVGTTAVGVAVGAVLGLFVFGAVVIAGAFVTAGFFSLTVTLQVSFFFPTFANTTAFPAFLPFTTTLVFFFFERLTTFLPDLMDQTAFFPFFSLIVFFCPTEMLTFFVLSFGAFSLLLPVKMALTRQEAMLPSSHNSLFYKTVFSTLCPPIIFCF